MNEKYSDICKIYPVTDVILKKLIFGKLKKTNTNWFSAKSIRIDWFGFGF